MDAAEIKEMVRARYGSIAEGAASDMPAASCCAAPDASAADSKSMRMGYTTDEVAAVPEGANLGLGCGNPQAIAAMRPDETVIDLGSGAGFDCLLAARQVGAGGHVIGVDMTHEMLNKARGNAARVGADNVEFRLGEIEHLPIADDAADVILSNCVINLVPDKAQVFREAFRVLKPGGRLAISDVVNVRELTPELATDRALVCGCIAGAAPERSIRGWLEAAGFRDVRIAGRGRQPGSVGQGSLPSWTFARHSTVFESTQHRKILPLSGRDMGATSTKWSHSDSRMVQQPFNDI